MNNSKRAVHFCVISIVIATVFLIMSQIERSASWNVDRFVGYLITFQYMSIFIGFAVSMVAISEKEKSPKQRWAIAINVLLFLALATYFIYQYFSNA